MIKIWWIALSILIVTTGCERRFPVDKPPVAQHARDDSTTSTAGKSEGTPSAKDTEDVRALVDSALQSRSLFKQKQEFLALTLLKRLGSELVSFEIAKDPIRTWAALSNTQSQIYWVNVFWKSLQGAGSGKILVGVLVNRMRKEVAFYFGQEENAFDRKLSSVALAWNNSIALLQQIRNESTYHVHEKTSILTFVNPFFVIRTDQTLLDSLASDQPTPWGPIVYRNKEYQRSRRKVLDVVLKFYPGIGIPDDQFLPAWQTGDVDGDNQDDLVVIVQMENYSPSMLVLLSSYPNEPFTLGKLGQDFAILPRKKAIHLVSYGAASGNYVWDGRDFVWKQLGD